MDVDICFKKLNCFWIVVRKSFGVSFDRNDNSCELV